MSMKLSRLMSLWFVPLALGASALAGAKDIYVSPSGSDSNPGTKSGSPLRTIAAASGLAAAGDTVHLAAGQYTEAIVPGTSGTASAPITYSGAGQAVITNVKVGILVSSQAYLVFDGITVDGQGSGADANVRTFVVVQNSHNITVRHSVFRHASDWAGVDIAARYSPDGRYYAYTPKSTWQQGSTSNITLEDSTFDDVGNYPNAYGDVIQVVAGTSHILIQRNTITHGGHDLVEFDCDYGVLQNNTLNNSYADTVGGDTGYRSIEVQGSFNVVQGNLLTGARQGGQARVPPLASVRGSSNIVRQNIFSNGIAQGEVTWCGEGQTPVMHERIYNNTMFRLGSTALSMWAYSGCTAIGDLVFANNLVARSRIAPGVLAWAQHGGTLPDADLFFAVTGGAGLTDMGLGPTAQSVVKGNLFMPSGGGPAYVMGGPDGRITLAAAAAKYPQYFNGNIEAKPAFVVAEPAAAGDFRLAAGSPGSSGGVFLTQVAGSGSGNRIVVKDSTYFSDGNGVIAGDTIQLQNSTQTVTITGIDRGANALTLSSSVTFSDGQGVALPFTGTAPDIGAGAVTLQPSAPKNFAVHH
jgi:hypothetical protein